MTTYQLLQENDPAPFRVENEEAATSCVIICDHAGQNFPSALGQLGIADEDKQKHITYDIGTEDIGLYLSEKMDATAYIAHYSRLVADVNRSPLRPDFAPEVSDNHIIPGNRDMSDAERQARINEIYTPYQEAVGTGLQRRLDNGQTPLCLSIHSFTPEMDGVKRPWEIAILWSADDELAPLMIEALRRNNPDLTIGDNEPYSLKIGGGRDYSNTVEMQATARGVPSLIVEFRQDLVATPEGARKYADIFYESLMDVLENTDLYRAQG